MPGYQNPEKKVYKVVKDASSNYTIDYLYLDDNGDTCPLPSDAASIKAKKISYTRAAKYMTNGFVSVCMPFALDNSTLPGGTDCKVKVFDQVKTEGESNVVYFKDAETIAAGVPYFLYLPESARQQEWSVTLSDENGIDLVIEVSNPDDATRGIYGSFTTVKTGEWTTAAPMYKIKNDGVTLVKTTENSNCYPYRGYLKLPAQSSGSVKDYVLSFEDYNGETIITDINGEVQNDAPRYNLMGQKVNRNAKGIIITGGKKVLVK